MWGNVEPVGLKCCDDEVDALQRKPRERQRQNRKYNRQMTITITESLNNIMYSRISHRCSKISIETKTFEGFIGALNVPLCNEPTAPTLANRDFSAYSD